jgi:hypothetical protein
MPIRVKNLNRRDSRDSLTSTDHLISIYSLESKDPSFEAYGAVDVNTQRPAIITTRPPATASSSKEAMSWSKNPWALCFPPQLQMNVQQIGEHLKVVPVNYKLTQTVTQVGATAIISNKSLRHRSDANGNTGNSKSHINGHSSSSNNQHKGNAEGSYGYEYEHKEDIAGNIYALPLEQSLALPFSDDDDSVTSWSSQNAVKFKKKRKPKGANHGHTTESSALMDPAICPREQQRGGKPDHPLESKEADGAPAEQRTPQDSTSKDASALFQEKREESEAEPSLILEPRVLSRQMDEAKKDEHLELQGDMAPTKPLVPETHSSTALSTRPKKSVRFTSPVVTSQYFRPRTLPEDISLLFFDEYELELLEEDRETTSRDQFEMIAQELSENRLRISIAYQNRWRDHQRRRNSTSSSASCGSTLQVAASASDA